MKNIFLIISPLVILLGVFYYNHFFSAAKILENTTTTLENVLYKNDNNQVKALVDEKCYLYNLTEKQRLFFVHKFERGFLIQDAYLVPFPEGNPIIKGTVQLKAKKDLKYRDFDIIVTKDKNRWKVLKLELLDCLFN